MVTDRVLTRWTLPSGVEVRKLRCVGSPTIWWDASVDHEAWGQLYLSHDGNWVGVSEAMERTDTEFASLEQLELALAVAQLKGDSA